MNGNTVTYVYITKAMKQSTCLIMLDNIRYMLLIPTTPVYIRELVQNKSVKKVCISHDLIGFVKINKSPQIHIVWTTPVYISHSMVCETIHMNYYTDC